MRPLLLSLLLASLSSAAFASLKPISEAPYAVEEDNDCQVNADNSSDCRTSRQYTILQSAGKDALSRIAFTFTKDSSIQIQTGEVRQPDGHVVPLSQAQMETRDLPNPNPGIGGYKMLSLVFPELTVGSVIRIQFLQHTARIPISHEWQFSLNLAAGLHRYDRLSATFHSERPLFWRSENTDSLLTINASPDHKQLTLSLKQPFYRSYSNEFANGHERRWPRLEIATSEQPQDHFASYAEHYNAILAAPLPPKAAAVVAAQQGKPQAQQVAAFMQHINSQYRYLSDIRLSERGWVPFSLAEIEQHGYGDCKDLSTLFTAMLRAAGIAAEPALIKRGVYAPPILLPGNHNFNHAIARAVIDGKTWWLDPTNSYFDPGRIPADLQERTAYRLAADNKIIAEDIPAESVSQFSINQEVVFHPDGSAQIIRRSEVRNDELVLFVVRDRNLGFSSSNKAMCRSFAQRPQNCQVERAPTSYVLPPQYRLVSQWEDLRAAEKISGLFLFDPQLTTQWNAYDSYRDNDSQTDMYLGSALHMEQNFLLKNAKSVQAGFSCQARSPWFDMALTQQNEAAGVRLRYQVASKVRWMSHDDIVSPAFIAFGKEARDCANQARQLLQLAGQKPARAGLAALSKPAK